MGRNIINIDDDHYIVYGYDAPCSGYFAEYHNRKELREDANDSVGFFIGVNKTCILKFLEKYNAVHLARTQTPKAFNLLCLDLPC